MISLEQEYAAIGTFSYTKGRDSMDEALQELHALRNQLNQERIALHRQLVDLRCKQNLWFLQLYRSKPDQSDHDRLISRQMFEVVREEIQFDRDWLESQLVEKRLLLSHVEYQINHFMSLSEDARTTP